MNDEKVEDHAVIYTKAKADEEAKERGIAMAKIDHVVANFGADQRSKMYRNLHKRDWREMPLVGLHERLLIEVQELKLALEYEGDEASMGECVDVANFAMMLWDRLREKVVQARDAALRDEVKNGDMAIRIVHEDAIDPRLYYKSSMSPNISDWPPSEAAPDANCISTPDGGCVSENCMHTAPAPQPIHTVWRHGQWMQGNEELAEMYRDSEGKIWYSDTEHSRARKLDILPSFSTIVEGERPDGV